MVELSSLLPDTSSKKVIKRVRELEHKAGSLPVLFALFFQESLKQLLISLPIPLPSTVTLFIAAVIIAAIFIFDEQKKKAAEKAKETAEKAKDKVSGPRQSKLDEYIDDET